MMSLKKDNSEINEENYLQYPKMYNLLLFQLYINLPKKLVIEWKLRLEKNCLKKNCLKKDLKYKKI